MIHTDEDDEFERIKRENQMKGQPYHWEADAIKAAVLIEREACARIVEANADACSTDSLAQMYLYSNATAIRARGNT
jgi:hypothetical protein